MARFLADMSSFRGIYCQKSSKYSSLAFMSMCDWRGSCFERYLCTTRFYALQFPRWLFLTLQWGTLLFRLDVRWPLLISPLPGSNDYRSPTVFTRSVTTVLQWVLYMKKNTRTPTRKLRNCDHEMHPLQVYRLCLLNGCWFVSAWYENPSTECCALVL